MPRKDGGGGLMSKYHRIVRGGRSIIFEQEKWDKIVFGNISYLNTFFAEPDSAKNQNTEQTRM
jgi:hypothetical protein